MKRREVLLMKKDNNAGVSSSALEYRGNGMYEAWRTGLAAGLFSVRNGYSSVVRFNSGMSGTDIGKVLHNGTLFSHTSSGEEERRAAEAGFAAGLRSSITSNPDEADKIWKDAAGICRRMALDLGSVKDFYCADETRLVGECYLAEKKEWLEFGKNPRKWKRPGNREGSARRSHLALMAAAAALVLGVSVFAGGRSKFAEDVVSIMEGTKKNYAEAFFDEKGMSISFENALRALFGGEWRVFLERDVSFVALLDALERDVPEMAKKDALEDLAGKVDLMFEYLKATRNEELPLSRNERVALAPAVSGMLAMTGDTEAAAAALLLADPSNPEILEWFSRRGMNPDAVAARYLQFESSGPKGHPLAAFAEATYGSMEKARMFVLYPLRNPSGGDTPFATERSSSQIRFASADGR